MSNSTDKRPIKIQVLNPVHSIVLDKQGYRLAPAMSYHTEYYIQGPYKKNRKTRRVIIIEKLIGKFPTGLLNRAIEYCDQFSIPLEIQYPKDETRIVPDTNITLPAKLWDYQVEAVNTALFYKRGVIVAPTGSGKTFIMASIASYFPNYRITFIVHTKTLLYQTKKELKKFFPSEYVGQIGEGKREYEPRITVAMIQTVHADLKSSSSPQVLNWAQSLGVVFVDECHHISKFNGSYVNFLSNTMAPARFGVTATIPPAEEAKLALEAYIGKVIYEVKMDILIEKGKLAVPKLKIVKSPEYPELKEIRGYKDVYTAGIITNRSRNRIILTEAEKMVKDDRTVLIIITRLEQGDRLIEMTKRMFPDINATFIHGDTDGQTREMVRLALERKSFDVVIASTIWKEGVDVPSLGAIINAAGGKSEIATIQTLGRGLRVAPGKDDIMFIDFFDNSHHYLISHFGERLCLYFDLGWM